MQWIVFDEVPLSVCTCSTYSTESLCHKNSVRRGPPSLQERTPNNPLTITFPDPRQRFRQVTVPSEIVRLGVTLRLRRGVLQSWRRILGRGFSSVAGDRGQTRGRGSCRRRCQSSNQNR